MLKLGRTWLFFIALLLAPGLSFVCAQHKTIKTFPVRTFYEDNGLISNSIFTLTQSSSGELWFGTAKGISIFDGIRWNQVPGSESFPFHQRSKLYALAGDSMLQLGRGPTGHAMARLYHQGKISELASLPNPLASGQQPNFNGAVQQENGKVEIALLTQEFLWLLDGLNGQWQKVALPGHIKSREVTKLIYYQNTLHLLTTKGLYSYLPNRKKFQQLWRSVLKDKVIVSATVSPDGERLYLLGNNWLAQCSNNRLQLLLKNFITPAEPFSPLSSYNILATKGGLLVFQIDNSLFLLNPESGFLEPFRLTNSFSTAIPTTILEDSEKNLWFGTLRGVALLNSLRFANMDKVVGLPDSEISTIFQIDSGTVLLGSNLGINVLKDYRWVQKAQGEVHYSNASHRIMDATRWNKHQIAIAGNQQGLGILTETDGYKTKWYPLPKKMLAVCVSNLNGQLLVGTEQGKVLLFEHGHFSVFLDLQQTPYIRRISTAPDGSLLLLTPNGLFRSKDSTIERLFADSPQGSNFFSMLLWKGQTLLGTEDGLYELKQGKIVPLQEPVPVKRPIYTMLQDKRGSLWMGTDKGVFVFDGHQLKNYNRYSGLVGQEVNRNALVEMKDDRIWIGTDRGLSIYDPWYDDKRTVIPNIRLKEIRSNDKLLAGDEEHQLYSHQNTLEFTFQPLTYHQPEALQFRYRLTGLESNWTYASNYLQNRVRFTSLPPGTYQFAIQARLEGGSWGPLVTSPALNIAAPFYAQGWFIALAILFVGFLGYLAHSLILHKSNEKRLKAAIDEKINQVAQSDAKFQAIWESMDSSVIVCNRNGQIVMSNPSFCRLFNQSAESLKGKEVFSILNHSRFSKGYIDSWYKEPALLRFEVELKADGLAHYLLATFSYLDKISPEEPLLIIGLKNVSHQKEAEMKNLRLNELLVRQNRDLVKKELELASFNRELLKRQKELQAAMHVLEERNFELDQFVYKTSHDLRAPIASSIGLLNIMKMEGASTDWPRYVDMILHSLQKQDNFIKAMLNFSKTARANEKPELIDFEQLVGQCLFDLQYLPGFESISKDIQVNDACANFFSDKMKINIVLSNILSNAIKYRDSGKASQLKVVVHVTSAQTQINISDNGIGINKDYLKHVFDMFYRATERSDGSGLGLYIVKQTVERLGGTIEVTSELGIGSCFKISIPNLLESAGMAVTKNASSAVPAEEAPLLDQEGSVS